MIRTNFIQIFALGLVVSALGMGAVAGVYSSVQGSKASVPVKPAIATSEPAPVELVQAEGDSFASRLRNHRIRLSADGFLPGKINLVDEETGAIRVLRDLKVMFIQNGEVKATVTPGEGGTFQANISPGTYSLAAIGPEGYVAYGLEVLPAAAPAPALPPIPADGKDTASTQGFVETQPVFFQEVSSVLEIDSLAIPRRDFEAVVQLARSYIPAEILNPPSPGSVPELANTGESLDEPPPTDEAAPNSVMRHHEVQIGADGTLSGRTRRMHPQTGRPTRLRRLNVFLVQNNAVVSQAPVGENGTFTFSSVAPGTYSFVAAGLEGFTAFSLRAVGAQGITDKREVADELIVPVAFQGGEMYLLDGVLVSPENLAAALRELLEAAGVDVAALEEANPVGPNGEMGTPGNGYGGGGGGAGGGGDGLLGALFGAALGAGLAALADDGGEIKRQTPTTTTP